MNSFLGFAVWLALGGMALAMDWARLPSLPDDHGFAGSFAGVSQGCLIVAGGTNFPREKPWESGKKVWYDRVYALSEPTGKWQILGQLPRPNAYGVSVTTNSGFLLIGGGDAQQHFDSVFRLESNRGHVVTKALPALPKPCAFMTGAVDENRIYIAGGIQHPDDTQAMEQLWMLDLKALSLGWQTLPPCPGKPRILAQMAAIDGAIYLIGGAALHPGKDGKAVREWLRDAWRFSVREGWVALANVPNEIVAAPSPLLAVSGKLWIFGGDDGLHVDFQPKEKHPGFPKRILAYDTIHDHWALVSGLPFALVTTPLVPWRGRWVVPGGESRPGTRSTEVWWSQMP
jgi:N-acetylneuraminate epimerase